MYYPISLRFLHYLSPLGLITEDSFKIEVVSHNCQRNFALPFILFVYGVWWIWRLGVHRSVIKKVKRRITFPQTTPLYEFLADVASKWNVNREEIHTTLREVKVDCVCIPLLSVSQHAVFEQFSSCECNECRQIQTGEFVMTTIFFEVKFFIWISSCKTINAAIQIVILKRCLRHRKRKSHRRLRNQRKFLLIFQNSMKNKHLQRVSLKLTRSVSDFIYDGWCGTISFFVQYYECVKYMLKKVWSNLCVRNMSSKISELFLCILACCDHL